MTGKTKQCRWRTRLNFLARLKNSFMRKREKCDSYFHDLLSPDSSRPKSPSADAAHGEPYYSPVQHDNEVSSSNPASEYFDKIDRHEYSQQHQIPNDQQLAQGGTPSPGMAAVVASSFPPDLGLCAATQQALSIHGMDHIKSYSSVPMSVYEYLPGECSDPEFSDAVTELPWDEQRSLNQDDFNSLKTADTFESMESMMHIHSLQSHHQERTLSWQYVEFVRRVLLGESSNFGMVARIVCRISGFLRMRRGQRSCSVPRLELPRTLPWLEGKQPGAKCCTKPYKGVSLRRGRWTAEIRVGKIRDKVWLGSFKTEREAALAHDAGIHHCCVKKSKTYNFQDSPCRLGLSLYDTLSQLAKPERRKTVKRLADKYVREYGASPNQIQ